MLEYSLLLSALLFAPSCASTSEGPEWGGFRGNNGSGVCASGSLPDKLDPESNLIWRTEIPAGYSSPTVAGSRLFVTAAENGALSTWCLDRDNGEVIWKQSFEYEGERPGANSPAAPSPVTDGERVYCVFHHYGVVVYDVEGEELWKKPMGPFRIPHGMSTSPIVHDGQLILLADQDAGSFLASWDAASGEENWRVEREGVTHGYSTPSLYVPDAGPAQVVVSGSFQLSAYSAEDGTKLWWMDGSAWQAKCVPVIAGDMAIVNAYMLSTSEFGLPRMGPWEDALAERDANKNGTLERSEWEHPTLQQIWFIFDLDDDEVLDAEDYAFLQAAGSSTGGLFAVRLGGEGDITESHVAWKYGDRRGLPDIPSPVVLDGVVYMIKEGGLFTAVDVASGEKLKDGRVGESDRYYASPVAAGGRILTASVGGQLAVIEAGPEWEVLSVTSLDEEVWSTPAIAGTQVFVRSQTAIYCFEDA